MSTVFRDHIDGRDVEITLKPVNGDVRIGLENSIGLAKRSQPGGYMPGNAISAVWQHCVESIKFDGQEIDWRTNSEELEMLFDDATNRDIVEIILGEIVKDKRNRILLRKSEYADVFKRYVYKELKPKELDPTE